MPAAAPLVLILGSSSSGLSRGPSPSPAADDGAPAPELFELVRAMARADAERDLRALEDSTPPQTGVRVTT